MKYLGTIHTPSKAMKQSHLQLIVNLMSMFNIIHVSAKTKLTVNLMTMSNIIHVSAKTKLTVNLMTMFNTTHVTANTTDSESDDNVQHHTCDC